jgi:hypothetical protein
VILKVTVPEARGSTLLRRATRHGFAVLERPGNLPARCLLLAVKSKSATPESMVCVVGFEKGGSDAIDDANGTKGTKGTEEW